MSLMPIAEMHQQFLHWFDKQSNFSAPEVTPEEIDIYLNNAMYFMLEMLTEKGIERNQDWLDYTKNLTISYSVAPSAHQVDNKPNGQFVQLPSDYRLSLLEEADVSHRDCNNIVVTSRVPVVPVTRDEYSKIIWNPFKKPWKEEIIRITNNGNVNTSTATNVGQFEIISFSGATVSTYYLDYIKNPTPVCYGSQYSTPTADVSCELDSKAATKVVELAVKLAMKTLGDERVKIEQLNPVLKTID